ncbi:hypothetical protein L1987_83570 [Smallanthus sonchifolius]|uniref:Uncharacterized protein n=1 Tax=Smallanthus sonchifolius TaxID=185202 RepID=A0ACB8YCB5_9ASTR|nr:hypothetical protein L1987_83570 [Smallanthus sonchifolius]
MMRFFVILLIVHSCLAYPKSIIKTLPGYSGDLPFKFETGYIGIGENEDIQLFYYFVESTRNPKEDPIIFHLAGGPGASALVPLFYEIGPLNFIPDNLTFTVNPNGWTQMANIICVDIPAGAGFSYSESQEGWISSDTNLVNQATEFVKKFMEDHPEFSRNPVYMSGISYCGIIVPKVTLQLYEDIERGDEPAFNIQGYILNSPLTNKLMDFNSRIEYAHRVALISDDIYESAVDNCHGNYIDTASANSVCLNSLQRFQECTSLINLDNILEPFCDELDPTQDCGDDFGSAITTWANTQVVQQALNVRQGKVEKVELRNETLRYSQGKNDTAFYSYDIFSSFPYHKKLSSKNCRALIISGDHDMTFPYVGVQQWISALNLQLEAPWEPYYVDGQVGGYEMKYAKKGYSLTYATVKGAGHICPHDKPKETMVLTKTWFSSQTYSADS